VLSLLQGVKDIFSRLHAVTEHKKYFPKVKHNGG